LQNKELCGFDDVLRQCYCVDLASKYHNLVTISFFKKFQSSIVICNSFTPSIKTGVYLRIEWFLGVIYSIHLILIAGLFIFLSALGNKELSFLETWHSISYGDGHIMVMCHYFKAISLSIGYQITGRN
jgi:hypothetical protein